MLSNYLRVALRNLRKQGFYSSLNILGLAIAFAAIFLILSYLRHETSYEHSHKKSDRIYRITHHFQSQTDFEVHWARVPVSFVNELPEHIPEIEHLIRFQNQERKYVRIATNKFRPEHTYVTDADVFEVFDFELLEGKAKNALSDPYSVVLTRSLAEAYFGTVQALGKTLNISGDFDAEERLYTVRGVIEDLPPNTHLPVDMLISFANEEERTGWAYVYTLLAEGTEIETVEAKFPEFIESYTQGDGQGTISFVPQALPDIHLHSDLAREIVPGGSAFYIKVFFFVAIFILLIAIFNYLNLNNAISLRRSKEIGMRKVLGANKQQLIFHGLVESLLYSLIAAMLGGLAGFFLLPFFQQMLQMTLFLDLGWVMGILLLVALICGVLIGVYPAFFMTLIQPLDSIRQNKSLSLSSSQNSFPWKRIMVGLQFSAAILLISSTLIAGSQIRFLREKNLGLARDQVLAIPAVPGKVREKFPTLAERIKRIPSVLEVGACMEVPSRAIRDSGPVCVQGINEDPDQAPMIDAQVISPGFLDLMGIPLLAGEERHPETRLNFTPDFTEDYSPQRYLREQPRTYVINETAMRKLGWNDPEEALGQRINWSIGGFELDYGPITGVIKDYHQETLKNSIDPIVMFVEPIWMSTFLIKVNAQDIPQTLERIQGVWDGLFPTYPLNYHFLDDLYDKLYVQERVQFAFLKYLSILAIFLAFMGLFALIAYSLKSRRKELAIRKILGASARDILQQISKEYVLVLLLGSLLAIPLSYYALQNWLETFAYQIDVTGFPYLWSMGLIFLILFSTLALQTFTSMRSNPAEVLKEE